MEMTKKMEGDLHKFTAYVSSFHPILTYGEDIDHVDLDLSMRITWPEEVIKCISWYMHTYDQYQVPAKMRKRSKNSIVFDVANFLLSKTTYDSKTWVVGYVRKRCHRLMKHLIIIWYTQGYLTKTQKFFRKSLMFKECWEHARERLRRGSDESNTLGNEEPFTKRKTGNIELINGKSKKVRQYMVADDTIPVNTSNRINLVEDWIYQKSFSNTEAETNITHPITSKKSVEIDPELQKSMSKQKNSFSILGGENGSVVDVTLGNERRVDMRDELYRQPRKVLSGDEPSPRSTTTITPKNFHTPIIYPALPQTPPSKMMLDESPPRAARASRDTNTASPSYKELHDIPDPGNVTALPIEKIMKINTMLERFRSIATIITPERGLWVMMPAGPVLDDFNFHTWNRQKFGLDEAQGLRFHYMDSWLNPSSCPVDIGHSDREGTILKQHLFFDFVETYNHFKGNLRTYRIVVIPENIVRLSISCRRYPLQNKEKLFTFYHECEQKLPLFSVTKSSNSQSQTIPGSEMYYKQERRLGSTSLIHVMEPSNSSPIGPPSHVSKFASSRIHDTKLGIQPPTLLPPINLPLRKLPHLGELDARRFINHYQLAGEPEIVVRVQKADGKFTGPLRDAPFGPGVKTQDFFTSFIRVTSQPSTRIPDMSQICFKDAVPVIEYEIYRGDERQFTNMWRNILPQCRRTVEIMSPMSEFVIFIRALHWHAGSS
ncbi:hypothetical protein BOTNAR_0718g00040 [Botryotinia narcissicola]|uniref:Uncharacterized protein n=1 Tax=Botryotinia narcissicola TaxID=278944 RepID=A0A4Z1HIV8_9HELO|nr:hypothetical protein BOTNAR_0718g00040 [Botryotinia narcissicola]